MNPVIRSAAAQDSAFDLVYKGLDDDGLPLSLGSDQAKRAIEDHFLGFAKQVSPWKNKSFFSASADLAMPDGEAPQATANTPYDHLSDKAVAEHGHFAHYRQWTEVVMVAQKDIHMALRSALMDPTDASTNKLVKQKGFRPLSTDECRAQVELLIDTICDKCEKGRASGSYAANVKRWGRGVLVVGLPLWPAPPPASLSSADVIESSFEFMLAGGIKALIETVLSEEWCPFDGIVVIWEMPKQVLAEWKRQPGTADYTDPKHFPAGGLLRTRDDPLGVPDIMLGCRRTVAWERHKTLSAFVDNRPRSGRAREADRDRSLKRQLIVLSLKLLAVGGIKAGMEIWNFNRVGWRSYWQSKATKHCPWIRPEYRHLKRELEQRANQEKERHMRRIQDRAGSTAS